MIELGLELVGLRNPILLGLPPCRQIGGVLFERDQLLLEPLEPLLRTWIALSPECLLLHLEPHDLTVDRIQRLRFGINLYLEPRGRLIDQVDRLIRQETIASVTMTGGQSRCRDQCRIRNPDAIMLLVAMFQASQDRNRFFDRGLRYKYRLQRRAKAASFSIYLLYPSSVATPMHWRSSLSIPVFSRFEAATAFSVPLPMRLCISSMNRMMPPSDAVTSCSTAFSRSSNSPRYLAPAISAPMSSATIFLSSKLSGTSPEMMRRTTPLTIAVCPTLGSPITPGWSLDGGRTTCRGAGPSSGGRTPE